MGQAEIRIYGQGLPEVIDRLVEFPRAGQDFAEVEMRGGQLGIDFEERPGT